MGAVITAIKLFLLGFIPHVMLGWGTGDAVLAKSPWHTWAYLAGSLIGWAIGIFWARRHM